MTAHVGQISDSALQTSFIAQWARPAAVRHGADINVFDYEGLTPGMPEMVHDLSGGALRFVNKTAGIRATLVGGDMLMETVSTQASFPAACCADLYRVRS